MSFFIFFLALSSSSLSVFFVLFFLKKTYSRCSHRFHQQWTFWYFSLWSFPWCQWQTTDQGRKSGSEHERCQRQDQRQHSGCWIIITIDHHDNHDSERLLSSTHEWSFKSRKVRDNFLCFFFWSSILFSTTVHVTLKLINLNHPPPISHCLFSSSIFFSSSANSDNLMLMNKENPGLDLKRYDLTMQLATRGKLFSLC